MLMVGCQKENNSSQNKGTLKFSLNPKQASTLKSAQSVGSPAFILVDIANTNGETVQSYLKLDLYIFQESYISKPFAFEPGSYKLTSFMVLDKDGNTLYAAPKEDSKLAYLVNDPLDIEFEISTDNITLLNPEVLSTETMTAADFGYFDASFTVVETFDFLITTFVYNVDSKNFELTNSELTVSSASLHIMNESLLAKTNQVRLNASIESYEILIEKSGYKPFISTISTDSLKQYFTDPWVIVLEKDVSGLIAWYPFNGNADDETGNGKNGIVNGASLSYDRFQNPNSAYLFDGNNSYIELPNSIDILPRSIDLWFNSADADYSNSYGSILQSDNPDLTYGNTGVAIKDIDGVKKLLLTISAVTDTFELSTNTWYNIAMVADGTREISFYVNGELIGQKSFPTFLGSVNGLNKIIIGAGRLAGQNFFNGKIDDIRIYNKVLTPGEVETIFNGGEVD
jgi:hypothetical protein